MRLQSRRSCDLKHPAEFRQDWVSYMGTGRNVFGIATLHGHGRPGPIISLSPELIADYCGSASETDKRRLYDVFASGEKDKIRELIEQIIEGTVRTGAGSAEAGEQAALTSFGPAIERQVRIRTWWTPAEHDVLNLDDGQLMAVPTNIVMGSINNPRPFLKWMVQQGADLDVTTGNSLTNLSLHLDDGRLALLEGNLSFDSIAAAEVERQLAERGVFQHQYVPKPEKGTGATLAFRTREGGVGVLQVLEFTPEGHPTVKIRYKLLQRAKGPR